MRTLTALSIATLILAGCYIGVGINHAGPAYEEAGSINNLSIVPATLPSDIKGSASAAERERVRGSLPSDAARWLAGGITDETDSAVWANAVTAKPSTGYYMTFEITYLDLGNEKVANETAQEDGLSQMVAKGRIYNAASGELVAELTLDKTSGFRGDPPVQQEIQAMARDIGKWFKERRK
jgi:hypothetical protein